MITYDLVYSKNARPMVLPNLVGIRSLQLALIPAMLPTLLILHRSVHPITANLTRCPAVVLALLAVAQVLQYEPTHSDTSPMQGNPGIKPEHTDIHPRVAAGCTRFCRR